MAAVARGDADPDCIVRDGRLVNVHTGEVMPGTDLVIAEGRIVRFTDTGEVEAGEDTDVVEAEGQYLAPGFLDTHVHYESSMVTATGFCRGVIPTGSTGSGSSSTRRPTSRSRRSVPSPPACPQRRGSRTRER
jgi:adenine deaminase